MSPKWLPKSRRICQFRRLSCAHRATTLNVAASGRPAGARRPTRARPPPTRGERGGKEGEKGHAMRTIAARRDLNGPRHAPEEPGPPGWPMRPPQFRRMFAQFEPDLAGVIEQWPMSSQRWPIPPRIRRTRARLGPLRRHRPNQSSRRPSRHQQLPTSARRTSMTPRGRGRAPKAARARKRRRRRRRWRSASFATVLASGGGDERGASTAEETPRRKRARERSNRVPGPESFLAENLSPARRGTRMQILPPPQPANLDRLQRCPGPTPDRNASIDDHSAAVLLTSILWKRKRLAGQSPPLPISTKSATKLEISRHVTSGG